VCGRDQSSVNAWFYAALPDLPCNAIVSVLLQHEADVGAPLRISRLECASSRVAKTSRGTDNSSWNKVVFVGLSTTRKEQWEKKHSGTHMRPLLISIS